MLRSASVTNDSAIAASCDEPLAAGRVGRTPRGGSTQSATPRGLDCIVCRIWQGRTRIGPSVRQRPPRFSNITESVGCLHVPHEVVPGTFVDYAFLFFLLSASGEWVKIKLDLHLRTRVGYVLCTTYVQPRISSYVPGMSRIPRYVYVGTYVPGLHPPPQKE